MVPKLYLHLQRQLQVLVLALHPILDGCLKAECFQDTRIHIHVHPSL